MSTVEQLRRERPRNRLARASVVVMLLLVVTSWSSDAFDFGTLGTERARQNLGRFLTELRPYPLQGTAWDWGVAAQWFRELTGGRAGAAMANTLAFSIARSFSLRSSPCSLAYRRHVR